jgi:hypothetical protein
MSDSRIVDPAFSERAVMVAQNGIGSSRELSDVDVAKDAEILRPCMMRLSNSLRHFCA